MRELMKEGSVIVTSETYSAGDVVSHVTYLSLSVLKKKATKIKGNNVPQISQYYAALRAAASFRETVISIIFSSLPLLAVMNIRTPGYCRP
jgi:hypothetical protein